MASCPSASYVASMIGSKQIGQIVASESPGEFGGGRFLLERGVVDILLPQSK